MCVCGGGTGGCPQSQSLLPSQQSSFLCSVPPEIHLQAAAPQSMISSTPTLSCTELQVQLSAPEKQAIHLRSLRCPNNAVGLHFKKLPLISIYFTETSGSSSS